MRVVRNAYVVRFVCVLCVLRGGCEARRLDGVCWGGSDESTTSAMRASRGPRVWGVVYVSGTRRALPRGIFNR